MPLIKQYIGGTTFRTFWFSSGTLASPILSLLYSGSETLVGSVSMSGSTNGYHFAFHDMPTQFGFYVNEVRATVNGRVFIARQHLESVGMQVD